MVNSILTIDQFFKISLKHYNLITLISLNSIKYSFSALLLANFKGSWIKQGLCSVPSKPNYSAIVGFYHYFLADFCVTSIPRNNNKWQMVFLSNSCHSPRSRPRWNTLTKFQKNYIFCKGVENILCLKGNPLIFFNNLFDIKFLFSWKSIILKYRDLAYL